MDSLIETREYKGYTIEIHADYDPISPRDWDNFGSMVCFHRNYDLGDPHDYKREQCGNTLEDLAKLIEIDQDSSIEYMPLWLLDHSGLWMQTGRFWCDPQMWDSGIVGLIYVTDDRIKAEYSVKHITEHTRQKALDVLQLEVDVYSQCLSGDVYGFIIKDGDENDLDSCWGFFGDPEDYMVKECESIIDHIAKNAMIGAGI